MVKRLLSIGECLVEMAALGNGTFRQGFAGDAFNAAWHARHALGPIWRVQFFTALGDDDMSTRMIEFMEGEGIDTSHVARLPGRAPGLYMIELRDGERKFAYWRDTSAAKSLADDPETLDAAVSQANAIFFSGITLAILAPDARGQLLSALDRAKARGATVAFDSNLRPQLWPDLGAMRAAIRAAARVSTIALPTVPDEAELFGESDAKEVAARYQADGVAEVVVRSGPGPALVVWSTGRAEIRPDKTVRPVDATGAGDGFNGTYLAARLQGAAPDEAARKAHSNAAQVISGHGALV